MKVRVGDVMVDTELGVTQGQKPKSVVAFRTGKRKENASIEHYVSGTPEGFPVYVSFMYVIFFLII